MATERDYSGMTVNERLYVAGLLNAFDLAAKGRDRPRMVEILVSVYLPHAAAQETTDSILANPGFYGILTLHPK